MNFKIDTKEKFTIIMPLMDVLSDNLTAELFQSSTDCLKTNIRNIILNFKNVRTIDEQCAVTLLKLQQLFYERNASFVICDVSPSLKAKLAGLELNITPSESEAWDIVQMEEIERELMDGDDA
jgi:anti-anti-sigma regulatory factor